jgi:hypothetical protein
MPNWTATLTSAAPDSSGANAVFTITLKNGVTNETQTRTLTIGIGMSANWLKSQADSMIAALNARDQNITLAQNVIAAGPPGTTLSTG